METPILCAKRLILRPLAITDAPAAQRHFNNWNIIKNMGAAVPWPYPDNGSEDFFKNNLLPRIAKGDAHAWAITLPGDPELKGLIEFRLVPGGDGDRGFWLAEHLWGQGLMSEAVAAVNDFVFDVLDIKAFIVTNADFNPASRAIKEKSGAELIEIVEKPGAGGAMRKTEIWRITREAWLRTRQRA